MVISLNPARRGNKKCFKAIKLLFTITYCNTTLPMTRSMMGARVNYIFEANYRVINTVFSWPVIGTALWDGTNMAL